MALLESLEIVGGTIRFKYWLPEFVFYSLKGKHILGFCKLLVTRPILTGHLLPEISYG